MKTRNICTWQGDKPGAWSEARRTDAAVVAATNWQYRPHLLHFLHHLRHPRRAGRFFISVFNFFTFYLKIDSLLKASPYLKRCSELEIKCQRHVGGLRRMEPLSPDTFEFFLWKFCVFLPHHTICRSYALCGRWVKCHHRTKVRWTMSTLIHPMTTLLWYFS